jgi:PIN domain nuclease of toxin-antitoxin system
MNLLLDTQAFLWWSTARSKLSPAALTACLDRSNTWVLSVVRVWEIQIKSIVFSSHSRSPRT